MEDVPETRKRTLRYSVGCSSLEKGPSGRRCWHGEGLLRCSGSWYTDAQRERTRGRSKEIMKKILPVVLAAVLAFGCAVPAFADPVHHGSGRCIDRAATCRAILDEGFMPHIRSLHAQALVLFERASAAAAVSPQAAPAQTPSSPTVPAPSSASTPSAGYGSCGYYVDEDGDGICDYHGNDCWGAGRGSGYGAGTNGYGGHHGGGHHRGSHHY